MSDANGRRQPLVLASTSPRRRALLSQLELPFEVIPPSYEERDIPGVSASELVARHARGKASSVAQTLDGRVVVGVDTTVVVDPTGPAEAGPGQPQVFGKPATEAAAREMLAALSGRSHRVLSGLCLLGPGVEETGVEETIVTFRELAEHHLDWYLGTDDWRGLAGGYAIQGRAAAFVDRIEGDYFNVVGLPLARLVDLLEARFPRQFAFR